MKQQDTVSAAEKKRRTAAELDIIQPSEKLRLKRLIYFLVDMLLTLLLTVAFVSWVVYPIAQTLPDYKQTYEKYESSRGEQISQLNDWGLVSTYEVTPPEGITLPTEQESIDSFLKAYLEPDATPLGENGADKVGVFYTQILKEGEEGRLTVKEYYDEVLVSNFNKNDIDFFIWNEASQMPEINDSTESSDSSDGLSIAQQLRNYLGIGIEKPIQNDGNLNLVAQALLNYRTVRQAALNRAMVKITTENPENNQILADATDHLREIRAACLLLSWILAFLVIFVVIPLISKGRSIGKVVSKTYVVTWDGRPVEWWRVICRGLAQFLPSLPGLYLTSLMTLSGGGSSSPVFRIGSWDVMIWQIALFGAVFLLADGLTVFFNKPYCLAGHDYICHTKAIKLESGMFLFDYFDEMNDIYDREEEKKAKKAPEPKKHKEKVKYDFTGQSFSKEEEKSEPVDSSKEETGSDL